MALGALLAAVGLLASAAPAVGQTVPIRPTPTVAGRDFQVLPQPAAPAAPAAPATPSPARAGSVTPPATAPAAPAASPSLPSAPQSPNAAAPAAPAAVAPTGAAGPSASALQHVDAAAASLPPVPPGLRLAESALRVGETLRGEPLTIQPSTRDLAAAGGLPAGLAVYQLTGAGTWSVVPGQTQQAASGNAAGSIRFVPGEPGIYALLAKSPLPDAGDYPLTNGFFFRSPTDGGGFSVTDAGARFWEAYQRAGGLSALGRPTSRRFLVGAQLQQTFERGTIRADLPSGPLPGAARAAASAASATAHLGTPPPAPTAARVPEPAPLPAAALPR